MKRVTYSFVLRISICCGGTIWSQLPASTHPDRRPGGSTQIVGGKAMESLLTRLDLLFEREHPGVRLRLILDPSNDVGLGGISTGASFVSPLMRAATPQETRPFMQMHGHAPFSIAFGYLGCRTKTGMPLPGLYMNANAPRLAFLWSQVARILTRGTSAGDITQWGQLGIAGARGRHSIHIYGPADDGGFVSALRHEQFDGNPLAFRYEALSNSKEIAQAVRNDSYSIGLIEAWPHRDAPQGLRLVPIASATDEQVPKPPSSASCTDVVAKRYPFTVELRLYADGTEGKLNPLALAYLKLALSPAGQIAVRRSHSSEGETFLPLNASDLAKERATLH